MKLSRVFGCLLVLTSQLYAQMNDREIVKKLNVDWISCYVTRNTTLLESILADEIVLTDPTGAVLNKKAMLAGLNSPDLNVLSDHVDEVILFGLLSADELKLSCMFEVK